MADVLFIGSNEITSLATAGEHVDAVREAYRERGNGAPAEPRTTLISKDPPGKLTGYFAMLPETGAMGSYTYSAGFSKRDAWFVLPLFDAETGEPLALLDGAAMNPYKTGAAGAVGADALARADATTLGLIGSGAQARGQLRAVATVRDLDEVRVYSPTRSHRETFAKEMGNQLGLDVHAVGSSGDALAGADIVVTATTADTAVFQDEELEDGAHVTAMGRYVPGKYEVPPGTIARSTYVVDLRDRLTQDAGAYMHALDTGAIREGHAHGELGEVLVGTVPGRTAPEDVTLFDSGGTALETVASAKLLYDRAREAGVGTWLTLRSAGEAMEGK